MAPDASPQPEAITDGDVQLRWLSRLSWPVRIALAGAILVLAVMLLVWMQRETLVRDLVSSELKKQGIDARYEIESIGIGEQRLRNLVIGDPESPDLTIDRLVLRINPTISGVLIQSVAASGVRGRAQWREGRLSFGTLDRLIYTDSTAPFEWPDFRVKLADAQLSVTSPYGNGIVALDGEGHLRDGFRGVATASTAELTLGTCAVAPVKARADLAIIARTLSLKGPLDLAGLNCGRQGYRVARGAVALSLQSNATLDAWTANLSPRFDAVRSPLGEAEALAGKIVARLSSSNRSANYELQLSGVKTTELSAQLLVLQGRGALADDQAKGLTWQTEGELSANVLAVPDRVWSSLAGAARASAATPFGPLLAALGSEGRVALNGSSLSLTYAARQGPDGVRLEVDRGRLLNRSGVQIATARGVEVIQGQGGFTASGQLALLGKGLPSVRATFQPNVTSGYRINLAMQPYVRGQSSLALSTLALDVDRDGGMRFNGRGRISGRLADGRISDLEMPLIGRWSAAAGLAMVENCLPVTIGGLTAAGLTLTRERVTLCPSGSTPGVRYSDKGLQVASRIADLDLEGRLGESPFKLVSNGAALAWPGQSTLDQPVMLIGPAESRTRIAAASLTADYLDGQLSGAFAGGEAAIASVPISLLQGTGTWRFAEGALTLDPGSWTVIDQQQAAPRFQPLVSRNVTLRFADGAIKANGLLREPETGRAIVDVGIAHDLSSVIGKADLNVPEIRFDKQLQPVMVTPLVLGVVADVMGVVSGSGQIDWVGQKVTSTGVFKTDSLDLAGAFGQVTGLSGNIEFVDLLGMVTAPEQNVALMQVNAGVTVNQGKIRYRLLPDFRMQIIGGEWPFSGGRLLLEPTIVDIAEDRPRTLTFRLVSVDAAEFLTQFDYDNISATGHFSGVVPIVFDQNGGHLRGGLLTVDEGGGTLAYVGELTYQDLGTMSNFAFNALKSMRYRKLSIGMDGELDGEVITQVQFEGLQQGEGASRNFLTRQLEKLPIQFNVTIRAPFLQLISKTRSLYDTDYIVDPSVLGLLPGQANNPVPASPKRQGTIQAPSSKEKP